MRVTTMARLTLKARNALPAAEFAGPNRSFPVNDPAHAVAAKGRATQAVKAGRMKPYVAATIKVKANKLLGAAVKDSAVRNAAYKRGRM